MIAFPEILTQDTVATLSPEFLQHIHDETQSIICDLSQLKQFDSSALAIILMLRRHAILAGKTVELLNVPARIQELADLYGVAELFQSSIPTTTY